MGKVPFKNYADFKRKCDFGVKLGCIMHRYFVPGTGFTVKEMPVREISIVQTNCIALKTLQKNGEFANSFFHWPKASETRVQDNTLYYYETEKDGTKVLSLEYWIEDGKV